MKSWTLIVGMDFSDFGERAFRQAVRMAAHRAGECVVHIAHAVTEKDMASPGSKVERQAEALGHAPREIWNRVVKILEQEQIALDAVPIWQHVRLVCWKCGKQGHQRGAEVCKYVKEQRVKDEPTVFLARTITLWDSPISHILFLENLIIQSVFFFFG